MPDLTQLLECLLEHLIIRLPPDNQMIKANNSRTITDRTRKKTSTIKYLVPANFDEEKRKFFISNTYNPQFRYPQLPKEYFRKALWELKYAQLFSRDSLARTIEERRLEETIYKVELLLAIGNPDKITRVTEKLYQCTFDRMYVDEAKQALGDSLSFSENQSDPERVRSKFRKYLKRYGVEHWGIVISKQKDFNIQVRHKKERVRISEEVNLDFTSLDSLLAHEIDGHILRAVNAAKREEKIFENPLPFYIKTEEGLASYLGDYCAKNSELSKKHHAIKYLGTYLALNKSFRDVYNFFLDNGFTSDMAFQRAVRIKRGFTDTSLPGCNVREAIYWEGMIDVREFIQNGGNINKLYMGKVGLEDLEYLPEPDDVILPQRITREQFLEI